MLFSFSPSAHQRACAWKQAEREAKITSLPATYTAPLSPTEQSIHALPLSQLVAQCQTGKLAPSAIMLAYAKKALQAHEKTNCLSDVMFEEALAIPTVANWGPGVDDADAGGACGSVGGSMGGGRERERSLMGVPVSIKDTIDIEGHDSTIGFSRYVNDPAKSSSAIVQLLQDAGALIHAKTTVPTGLLSLETVSHVFGRTTNPYNPEFTAGASTGGGGALVALGGSKIEIGTDLAGSCRIPAHFCGVWSLKGSSGRFPSWGNRSSMPGLQAVPLVVSPLAGSLDDLREFWKRVILAEPWQYDHTCVPIPWQNVNLQDEGRKLKWGVIWEDGTIPPSPACKRALSTVITALKKQGHEVVEFQPPDVFEGLKIGYQLLFSDGGQQIRDTLQPGESLTPAAQTILDLLNLPKLLKRLLAFFTRSSDPISSQLYSIMHGKSVMEDRENVRRREEYKAEWARKWREEGLDFVLTVPLSMPALRNGTSERTTLMSAGHTPITHVSASLDALPPNFFTSEAFKSMPSIARQAYGVYDPEAMEGLPVGVQVVGRRLEEEKVLEGMRVVEGALREVGVVFGGMQVV